MTPLRFDDHPLDLAWLEDGRAVLEATQVSIAVGYADSYALARNVRQRWAPDLVEGVDYLFSASLAENQEGPGRPGLWLTESGLYAALLLARTEPARRLRRWLASEVLPGLRRDGAYALPGAAAAPDDDRLTKLEHELAELRGEVRRLRAPRGRAPGGQLALFGPPPPAPDVQVDDDVLLTWVATRCTRTTAWTPSAELYADVVDYCRERGQQAPGKNALGRWLRAHGARSVKDDRVRGWAGLRLVAPGEPPPS